MVRSYIHKEYYFRFLFTAVTDAALLFKVFKRQTEKKYFFILPPVPIIVFPKRT